MEKKNAEAMLMMATDDNGVRYLNVTQGNMGWQFRSASRERWATPMWQICDKMQDNDGVFHESILYTIDEIVAQLWK